jgi:site-specific DNA-methyltransferase (adenine-specific)
LLDEQSNNASRFFYCAKASKSERDIGCEDLELKQTTDGCIRSNPETARRYQANSAFRHNIHPTVKPLKLMVYLCNLTKTPTGGIVLDPFGGSGTTAMACKITGRDFILIEKEPEYIDIAIRRIEAI